ncbi:MAG: flagellar biosynthetic protein FliQ [Planctomycetaceae bacterium]|nr:flagellar biosynthetic protein FliQ [Planctomycetaceae bacterium]MCP4464050.1 flagellar biosynthetic protein FliQ [Planctomycetaceae bacterium]MDG1808158.1 flagellar biosynthetic protein FliQ [Pirellulaceae bacterium]MDG2103845.1 flagellar biosynthetic protein FliQ [Pirellulaceae bacterium]
MSADQMVQMLQEFLYLGLLLVAPAVLTSLLIGLLIAIFQTITSIQEQTLTFAPRIVAVAVVIALTLTWSLNLLIDFTQRVFMQMSHIQI